jgi:uncharacterized protein YjbJ (UPF0337 family)
MTTQGPAGRPGARHQPASAENDAEPGGTPEAGPRETAVPAAVAGQDVSAAAAPPDDPQQLAEEIKRTREQLGETVEQLAAKADVKARAQDKASQLTGRLKDKAGQVQRQLADKTTGPRQKVVSVSGPVQDQVRQQAARAAARVSEVTPEPVRRAAVKVAVTARQRRVMLAAAIGAGVLAWMVIARWRRR